MNNDTLVHNCSTAHFHKLILLNLFFLKPYFINNSNFSLQGIISFIIQT